MSGYGQGSAAEFFGMMTELPVQLTQINDRAQIQKIADVIGQTFSTVTQELGIKRGQMSPSAHQSRWKQVPHLPEQTATQADQLTEISQRPQQHAPQADQGTVDRVFGDANSKLSGSLREAGISGQATSTRKGAHQGAGLSGTHKTGY